MTAAAYPVSHRDLLQPAARGRYRPLDAVIVPASRSAENLRAAGALAHKTDSELLVLCSEAAQPEAIKRVLADERVERHYVVNVPVAYTCDLVPAGRPPAGLAKLASRPELSRKRNVGLLVARMVGWRTVLFLDDDIDLDVADVVSAQHGLEGAAAVGFRVTDWPDNSVVGHANRASGVAQDVFVGPSALLVDIGSKLLGHFPTIYNEGVFFLFEAVAGKQVRCAGHTAVQRPYDPFQDPHRGRDEEFGDVIGDGLLSFLMEQSTVCPSRTRYWREFLARRRAHLRGVAERLLLDRPPSPWRRSALGAIRSAQSQHALISPAACAQFVRHWRADQDQWARQLKWLGRLPTVRDALGRLDLLPPVPQRPRVLAPSARPLPSAPPTVITTRVRATPGSDALAVLIPGFLDSGSWTGASSLAAVLQRSGRTAMSFDPRGSFRTLAAPDQLRPSRQISDTISAIGMMRPHNQTALIGHSLGASVAVFAAAQDDRVTDVVAIMPPRCFVWPSDYDPERDTWRRTKDRRFVVSSPQSSMHWQFKVPHSVVVDAAALDLPATLRGMGDERSILFIAGRDDAVIPVAAVERLFAECGSSRKTIAVLPVGHDYRDHPAQLHLVNDTVLRWLDAQPPPPEARTVGWRRAPAAASAPERRAAARHPGEVRAQPHRAGDGRQRAVGQRAGAAADRGAPAR